MRKQIEVEFPEGSGNFHRIREGNKIKMRKDGRIIQYNDNQNDIRRFFEDETVYPVVFSPMDPRSGTTEKERKDLMDFLKPAFCFFEDGSLKKK